jgi:RNA polymerase sigma-70 factor (ECF subfamily)
MAVSMLDIDTLIRQVPPGDPRLCEALMSAYYDFAYNLAVTFLGDPDESEDAAQETFIRATLNIERYQAGTSLKSWLAQITINLCRDRYRRRKVHQRLLDVLKGLSLHMHKAEPSPEDALIQNESRLRLKRAIDTLDDKHRLPLLLRYQHGLSVPEIARALDIGEGTVYSRLHYAHRKLRDRLERQAAGQGTCEEEIE